MRAISLLYHDVVLPGQVSSSGFPGGDADIYKLARPDFERHLNAIHSAIPEPPITVSQLGNVLRTPLLFTFDDGGVSAYEHIAGLLEAFGWRGHFFVTTNWIGRDGFLNPAQIRDLYARGHFIGSHSCSHPQRMSHCNRHQLRREWNDSIAVLSEILGARVELASVPGGFYARNVAEEAADGWDQNPVHVRTPNAGGCGERLPDHGTVYDQRWRSPRNCSRPCLRHILSSVSTAYVLEYQETI